MRNDVFNIAVLTTDGILYIVDPITKEWFVDIAAEFDAASVLDYKTAHHVLEQATNNGDNSQWGYVVSGSVGESDHEAGVAMIAADPDLPRVTEISRGTYSSVAYAAIRGTMPRIQPLVFAIDEDQKATYFQANGDKSFSAVLPLGADRRFTYLDTIFRTGHDSDGSKIEWIGVFSVLRASVSGYHVRFTDVYGLDTQGNVWHTRNDAYDGSRSSAVQTVNGYIFVSKWETPSIITSKPVKSFDVAVEMDGGGHAYVVTDLDLSSTTAALEAHVQDMASTTWTTSPISTVNRKAPEVYKRNVYYVEIAVRKGGIPAPGLTVKITAPEYCQIDANGVSTSVTPGDVYTCATNARGLICLTMPTTEALVCPALSVWVQGMSADRRVDVHPTGKIQDRFASITVDDLKNAKDQTDNSPIFNNLSPSDLQSLQSSLNKIATAFSSDSKSSSDPHAALYLHPKTSKAVASTRRVSGRHTGLISRSVPGESFRICLRPNLSIEPVVNSTSHFGALDEIVSSWGDFWAQVANGVVEVTTIVVSSIVDGVSAAIECIVDGVKKAWNGVTSFVRQAFDVIAELFKTVKVSADKVFNWLAFLFNWGDIKATAVEFHTIFDAQLTKAGNYLNGTARTEVNNFFALSKAWLKDNQQSILDVTKDVTVGDYDKPESDLAHLLPSSASWLTNKVDNASQSANLDAVTTSSDEFTSTFQKFSNNLEKTGISADLSQALKDAVDFFTTLTAREAMDKLTLDVLFQLFQDLYVLLLDFGQAIADTLLDLLVDTLKLVQAVMSVVFEIPFISKIYKDVVGLDLTFFNFIAVPMAVPSTVLYKAMVGQTPFTSGFLGAKREDRLAENGTDKALVWSAILTLLYGASDTALGEDTLDQPSKPIVIGFTWTNIIAGWVILQVGEITTSTPNTRSKVTLGANTIGMLCSLLCAVKLRGSNTPLISEVLGIIIPCSFGCIGFISGCWHLANIWRGTEPNTAKETLVAVGECFSVIPGVFKAVKLTAKENPDTALKVMMVADGVGHFCGAGCFGVASMM
ncbi:hypothetical protein K438DRAFT_1990236 [Mycena galopus ATCC 62051]|nr:hypothetical protein K438DRAFT_1990236 [Mycena galopus ATCC 62051]